MSSYFFTRIFYDLVAPVYDYFFGSDTRYVKDMRRKIVERLGLRRGARVLEVGVGSGANLPFIFKRIGKGGKIFGIDISKGMLDKCRKNLKKYGIDADLILGDALKLPYPDNYFDAVLGFGAINFLDRKKAIDEMVRVAKPGARIVIGDERFPIIGTPEAALKALPDDAEEVKVSSEHVLVAFWIIEFRKRQG
jgi:ubiquinone/menaquinone biosynthesis C-methylase UbiE